MTTPKDDLTELKKQLDVVEKTKDYIIALRNVAKAENELANRLDDYLKFCSYEMPRGFKTKPKK